MSSIGSSMWSRRLEVRQFGRVVDEHLGAVGEERAIDDRRRGRDDAEVELAVEALAHDLHVQQSQEPAAEAEAERLEDSGS